MDVAQMIVSTAVYAPMAIFVVALIGCVWEER